MNGARRIAEMTRRSQPRSRPRPSLRYGAALDEPPQGWGAGQSAAPQGALPPPCLLAGVGVKAGAARRPGYRAPGARAGGCATERSQSLNGSCPATRKRAWSMHPQGLDDRRRHAQRGVEHPAERADIAARMLGEAIGGARARHRSAVACIASIHLKADERGRRRRSHRILGSPAEARFFYARSCRAESPRLEIPRKSSCARSGWPGVAEAAALARRRASRGS